VAGGGHVLQVRATSVPCVAFHSDLGAKTDSISHRHKHAVVGQVYETREFRSANANVSQTTERLPGGRCLKGTCVV
jgi:hypothetical protein